MSYANLPAVQVLAACDAFLKAREKRISEERMALVEAEASKTVGLPFFRKQKSMSQAFEDARQSDEWELAHISGGRQATEIQRLRALSQIAGNRYVAVSSQDALALRCHWPKS